MAEKFHVRPRPVDRDFSSLVYNKVIKELDGEKIFFTGGDVNSLSPYEFKLDNEIRNQKSEFLSTIAKLFQTRIMMVDTMIDNICKVPFNFTLPEKMTRAEDTGYAADIKSLRIKLYKALKLYVLEELVDEDRTSDLTGKPLQAFVDSIEPSLRKKAQKTFKTSVSSYIQSPGGLLKLVGEEYCKAVATAYDPHTEYFPLTEKENFESELGQQAMAFGFHFKETSDGVVKIEKLAPGSPAFKSGQINKGDKIISVQWQGQQPIDVSTASYNELARVLSMSNHDKATFKFKKADGSERMVTLWKEKADDDEDNNKVRGFLLRGQKTIGYLSLPSFYEDWENDKGVKGCANDVAKEILKLKKENIQGLILDLRYNGGGSMNEAVELTGLFVDAGPVAQVKDRNSKTYSLKDVNRGTIYDGPLTILVNGYSASASEMVAGSLQDYNRALIIGSPTYGKATAQVVLPMDTTIDLKSNIRDIASESYLKMTLSELYRVKGTTAQASGVIPDIELPVPAGVKFTHESDNPNVLKPILIEANKYFIPYPALPVADLNSVAKTNMQQSLYFNKIKQYNDSRKEKREAISLRLSDAIAENELKEAVEESDTTTITNTTFTVVNDAYQQQQLQMDENVKETTEEWTKFLNRDAYVKLTYEVMLKMIK